jgi:hypothetical protein
MLCHVTSKPLTVYLIKIYIHSQGRGGGGEQDKTNKKKSMHFPDCAFPLASAHFRYE